MADETSFAALNVTQKATSMARGLAGIDTKNQGSQRLANQEQLLKKMLTDDE